MRSLALFKPTFQRLQLAFQQIDSIKTHILPKAYGRNAFQKLQRVFLVLNCLEHTASDLQSQVVEKELQIFEQFLQGRDMSASYDYFKKGHRLVSRSPFNENITKLGIDLRSAVVQKQDHPILRNTLYFHELKDMDKIFSIDYPKKAPRFIRDIYRRNMQNQLLDMRNPLGVPVHAPPLYFMVEINQQFAIEFYCRYGNINIKTVRLLRNQMQQNGQLKLQCHYLFDGMNIPRQIQKIVYSLCQDTLGLEEPELFHLHKVAYIGGRVQEIEFLLNLLQVFTHQLPQ